MRGHPYCLSCSLRIHSIFRAVRLCLLGRLAPRPAPRAARRFVMPPFSPCVLLLVPSCVRLVSSPLVPPLACFTKFPIVMVLSYRLTPRVPSLPAHRPADRVEQAGRHRLAYRCHVRRRRAASLPLSHAGRLCLLGVRCRSYLKTFPVNLLKLSSAMF